MRTLKIRTIFACAACAAALAGTGCSGYGTRTETTLMGASDDGCEPVIEIFMAGTYPAADYEETALLEFVGDEGSTYDDLLDMMAAEAAEVGADAVVDVRKTTETRWKYSWWDALCEHEPEPYVAPVLTGTAVSYVDEWYWVYYKKGGAAHDRTATDRRDDSTAAERD